MEKVKITFSNVHSKLNGIHTLSYQSSTGAWVFGGDPGDGIGIVYNVSKSQTLSELTGAIEVVGGFTTVFSKMVWLINATNFTNNMGAGTGVVQFLPTSAINYERLNYDPDLVWGFNPDTGLYEWMAVSDAPDITAAGGGRYGMRLICVGHNCVYYGTLT